MITKKRRFGIQKLHARFYRFNINPGMLYIEVYTMYFETCALLSSIESQVYAKEECKLVKVNIMYKSTKNSNKFLFISTIPIIRHSRF